MKVKEIVESQLLLRVKQELKTLGFSTSGNTWYFTGGRTFLFLNIQYSTSNIGSDGKFTFNFGFVAKSFLQFVKGAETSSKPKEIVYPVQRRIGEILDGRDRWYLVRSETNNEVLQAFEDIKNKLIPFLISLTDDSTIRDFLNVGRKKTLEETKMLIYLTALGGDKTGAIRIMDEYVGSISKNAVGALQQMEKFRTDLENAV